MATTIQIKRSSTVGNTPTLAAGELGINYGAGLQDNAGDRLYTGTGSAVHTIGGKYFTDMLDQVAGTLTASSAVLVDSTSRIDNLIIGKTADAGGSIELREGTNNGTNYIRLKAPAAISANETFILPGADGTAGQFLKTNGSGVLAFQTVTSTFTIDADTGTADSFATGETLTFTGAEGIDTSVSNNAITITAEVATDSNKGVATFNTSDFTITSGDITIKTAGVSNAQLAGSITNAKLSNSSVTIGSTATALGATSASLAGLESVVVDQLTIDGQDIATSVSNQDITLTPHGTGTVTVPSAYKDRAGFGANSLTSKAYVDAVKTGLTVKDSVRVATIANITIATALNNADTLDGVTLATNDRVLVKNQSTGAENGIYVVGSSPARAADMATSSVLEGGTFVFVQEGTANADNGYVVSTDGTITVNTTTHAWTQFSGAGQITAGDGLDKGTGATANTMDVNVDGTTTAIVSDNVVVRSSGTAGQVLRSDAATNAAGWGQLDLANSAAVTGTLPTSLGGTGLAAMAQGSILVANSLNTLSALDGGGSNDGLLLYTATSDTIAWSTTLDGGTF